MVRKLAGSREKEIIMSVWIMRDDFEAIGKSFGHKTNETCLDDAWMEFATFNGSAIDFFVKTQKAKPYRFEPTQAETTERNLVLYNVDEQTRYARANGLPALEDVLQRSGLKPGQFLPAPTEKISGKKAGKDNPWSAEAWNTTQQSRVYKTLGETKAKAIAAAAGCVLGSTKPNPAYN